MGVCTQRGTTDRRRVLVVDDDPEVLELTQHFLEQESNFSTLGVTDPEQALVQFDPDVVDCIVSDYEMPGMDGVEFCRQARQTDAVPCVVFSSADEQEIRSSIEAAGFEFVRKRGPDGYADLVTAVEERLGASVVA